MPVEAKRIIQNDKMIEVGRAKGIKPGASPVGHGINDASCIRGKLELKEIENKPKELEKVVRQGPVDHFKIKPGERKTKEEPKITKIFQEMGKEQENIDLVVFDVKRGIKVEDTDKKGRPNKVFQEVKSRK